MGHKEKLNFVAYSPQLILPQKLAMCDINLIMSIFYGQPNSARSNMQLTNGDTWGYVAKRSKQKYIDMINI
jgi:hypothetical protein